MTAAAPRFERALPAVPDSIPVLRAELTAWARGVGVDRDALEALRLTVTEAATNAVVHAYVGRPPGDLRVHAETATDQVVVRVVDDGGGMGPRHDSPGLGMGLPTMGRLAARVDLGAGPGGVGTEVRLCFAVPGLAGPNDLEDDLLREIVGTIGRLLRGDGFEDPDIGVLADMLVPRVADLCSITLLDADGGVRRVGAQVARPDGTPDPDAVAWLLQFPVDAVASPSARAAREAAPQFATVDDEWLRAVSPDEEGVVRMRELGLAWWLAVPLGAGGQIVGSVSVAGRRGRDDPERVRALVERIAARAGALVATAQLVVELRRTRRRFERILGALAEAVTVTEPDGTIVYANPAAAELLGAASVEEVLTMPSQSMADRFEITGEDGRPVPYEALPHAEVLAGAPSAWLVTRLVRRADGQVFWLRTTATSLDDDGPLVVNVLQDITAERA